MKLSCKDLTEFAMQRQVFVYPTSQSGTYRAQLLSVKKVSGKIVVRVCVPNNPNRVTEYAQLEEGDGVFVELYDEPSDNPVYSERAPRYILQGIRADLVE